MVLLLGLGVTEIVQVGGLSLAPEELPIAVTDGP